MRLPPPVKVGKLQTALHTKAKNSPDYRFYALYDKVYRRDVLEWAFVRCLRNGGVPGVDGQSFDDIEKLGRDQWLDELAEELRKGTYRPQPVRRAFIPKADGKQRPLGIPCIRDRVVQMAMMLVLGPIFEADLEPEQHAYRPERSALDGRSAPSTATTVELQGGAAVDDGVPGRIATGDSERTGPPDDRIAEGDRAPPCRRPPRPRRTARQQAPTEMSETSYGTPTSGAQAIAECGLRARKRIIVTLRPSSSRYQAVRSSHLQRLIFYGP